MRSSNCYQIITLKNLHKTLTLRLPFNQTELWHDILKPDAFHITDLTLSDLFRVSSSYVVDRHEIARLRRVFWKIPKIGLCFMPRTDGIWLGELSSGFLSQNWCARSKKSNHLAAASDCQKNSWLAGCVWVLRVRMNMLTHENGRNHRDSAKW